MEAARIISLPGQADTEPVPKISESSVSGQPENVRIILTKTTRGRLEEILGNAEKKGDLRGAKRAMAILAVADGHSFPDIASVLNVNERTVCRWFGNFLLKGPDALVSRKPPGRKSKLTKSQKRELDRIITAGPQAAGFSAACWRSPMIQALIYEKFNVFYAGMPFDEFVHAVGKIPDEYADGHFASQYRRLILDGEIIIDRLARFEDFWEETKSFLGSVGLDVDLEIPHVNKTARSKPYAEYYNDETIRVVAERYKEDIQFFGYGFNRP